MVSFSAAGKQVGTICWGSVLVHPQQCQTYPLYGTPMETPTAPTNDKHLQQEIAGLIVSALNLDLPSEAIEPDAPLYGEPLGLDSIDILEIALVVSKQFGVQIKADGPDNLLIFASLNALTTYISEHRSK